MKKALMLLVSLAIIFVWKYTYALEKPEIFPQLGHSWGIESVTFSTNGKYIISGSRDKSIKIWDFNTGREIRTLKDEDEITTITVSPNNSLIITGNKKGQIKLWNINNGQLIGNLPNDEKREIKTLSFSPDGRNIVSTDGFKLIFWDIESKKPVFKIDKELYNISCAVFSNEPNYIFMGVNVDKEYLFKRAEFRIDLYDIFNKKIVKSLILKKWSVPSYPFKEIKNIAISPDQKYLMVSTGGLDDSENKLYVIDFNRNIIIKEFSVPEIETSSYESISFSPDGRYAAAGRIGEILLIDAIRWKIIKKFDSISGSLAFHPSSNFFAFANYKEEDYVYGGSYQKDGIDIVDLKTLIKIKRLSGKTIDPKKIWWNHKNLIIDARDILYFWDIQKGVRTKTLYINDLEGNIITPDDISNDNEYISGSNDRGTYIYNLKTKKLKKIINETALTLFGSNNTLILVNKDEIIFWDIKKNFSFKKINWNKDRNIEYVYRFFISRDSKKIFIEYEKKNQDALEDTFVIFDNKGNKVFEKDIQSISSFSVSPDFVYVVFGQHDGIVKLYDGEGKLINTFKGHDDIINFLTFSEDSSLLLSGGFDHSLILWKTETQEKIKTFLGHQGIPNYSMLSFDNKYIVSSADDGTTRLWDVATGKEIAQFISFTDGEWVVMTPEGYFNASPNGAKHLNVRVGNNVYSIDNFYEKFFNPVYVASVLQGKKVEAVADIRKGILTPPDVKIISPEPNQEFSTDTITITVSAKDTGGGIDEIRLYHNGKAIGEDLRGVKIVPKGNETIKTYTVTLVDGLNNFRAVGFSKDRTESNPYELTVKLTAPSKDVSLYVLAVGINKYKNPALNLNYAEPDAKGITDFFRQKGKGLFKKVEVIEIYNEQATKEGITSKLKQLQNTHPQDAVLIYLAGHGENISEKWYFIPHELIYPEREDDVKAKGTSSDELAGYIRNIKAQKILVLIDACKSGAVLVAFRGFEDRKALSQLSRSTGVHVIAASTKDQFASEIKDLGHGVFTYTLLEGLKGKAAGGTETVTVRKLMSYVEEQLPEITKKYKQETQFPVVDSRGMDFPLVLTK